jgi:hypothetical protein
VQARRFFFIVSSLFHALAKETLVDYELQVDAAWARTPAPTLAFLVLTLISLDARLR